jgi:hypothetical protein
VIASARRADCFKTGAELKCDRNCHGCVTRESLRPASRACARIRKSRNPRHADASRRACRPPRGQRAASSRAMQPPPSLKASIQAGGRPFGRFCFWPRPCGVIEGVLAAAGVPITFITPPAWKRAVGLTLKSKDAARSEAIRRWPSHAALFARVKDDGRAESALIGVAGWTMRHP